MLSGDEEFLQYAQYFRMTKDNRHDFEVCINEINKRARYLGYSFELGCCGTNKLKRINK
jgi:hypothetical protein